jgi:hypothetical protein
MSLARKNIHVGIAKQKGKADTAATASNMKAHSTARKHKKKSLHEPVTLAASGYLSQNGKQIDIERHRLTRAREGLSSAQRLPAGGLRNDSD